MTSLMDGFETQSIASTSNTLEIERGKNFAFVSGIGGRSVRVQNDTRAAREWWAVVHTATQGAKYGSLCCTFNDGGEEDQGHCYVKASNGVVADEFDLLVHVPAPLPPPTATAVPIPGATHLGLAVLARFLGVLALWALARLEGQRVGLSEVHKTWGQW